MTVVSNTSPLTNLAAVGHFALLQQLYEHLHIPEAVARELSAVPPERSGYVAVAETPWLLVRPVRNRAFVRYLRLELGPGESEAIALGRELKSDLLLIDERKGSEPAIRSGLRVTGLLGVLLQAKQRDLIVAVRPILDELIQDTGFWVSDRLYERPPGSQRVNAEPAITTSKPQASCLGLSRSRELLRSTHRPSIRPC